MTVPWGELPEDRYLVLRELKMPCLTERKGFYRFQMYLFRVEPGKYCFYVHINNKKAHQNWGNV